MHAGLQALPIELIYAIQLFALSEAFPLLNKWTRNVFNAAHTSLRAEYLVHRFLAAPPQDQSRNKGLVGYALLFPLCSDSDTVLDVLLHHPLHDPTLTPLLPKRLFKSLALRTDASAHWSDTSQPLPFLRRLYAHPLLPRPPDANAHDGYALCRAVHANHRPLVAFLLTRAGARPDAKQALAVRIAIRKRDVGLVRMLLERDADEGGVDDGDSGGKGGGGGGGVCAGREEGMTGRLQKRKKSGKRRRLDDRMEVNATLLRLAVEADARDIVELFLAKGARPDMATLQRMRIGGFS